MTPRMTTSVVFAVQCLIGSVGIFTMIVGVIEDATGSARHFSLNESGAIVASKPDDSSISSISTTLVGAVVTAFTGMTALMAWVLKRMIDTTIPQQQQTFATALTQQQVTFTSMLSQQQQANHEWTTGQRESFTNALEKHTLAFRETEKDFQKIVEGMQNVHRQEMQEQREHYTKITQDVMKSILDSDSLQRTEFARSMHEMVESLQSIQTQVDENRITANRQKAK